MADKKPQSTQSYLDVGEIKNGVIVLKDGNLRGVLAVSSINFALKSETEQNAIIAAYQNFLNSLDFPLQIVMQSRPLDIAPYLSFLEGRAAEQTNKLMQIQTAEYIEFVSRLVETAEIMSKSFFVVIPYSTNAVTEGGFFKKISSVFNPSKSVIIDNQSFDEHQIKLKERMDTVRGGLSSMGLDTIELTTEELLELLYSSYNIGAASAIHADALDRLSLDSDNLNAKPVSQNNA